MKKYDNVCALLCVVVCVLCVSRVCVLYVLCVVCVVCVVCVAELEEKGLVGLGLSVCYEICVCHWLASCLFNLFQVLPSPSCREPSCPKQMA